VDVWIHINAVYEYLDAMDLFAPMEFMHMRSRTHTYTSLRTRAHTHTIEHTHTHTKAYAHTDTKKAPS
jgi:hypothetical protein